jgi:branched-subunit amino acid transport protein AzlD
MELLQTLLLVGSASSAGLWAFLKFKDKPAESSPWAREVAAEVAGGRSAAAALMGSSAGSNKRILHSLCRGIPPAVPARHDSGLLLFNAVVLARSVSRRSAKEVADTEKKMLDSFDEKERRLTELDAALSFRGSVLGCVLCFLVPFVSRIAPFLAMLNADAHQLVGVGTGMASSSMVVALVSALFLSRPWVSENRRWLFGRLALFTAVLFVSSVMADSLVGALQAWKVVK